MSAAPLRWPAIRAAFEACADVATPAHAQVLAQSGLSEAELQEVRSLLAQHGQGPGAATQGAAFLSGGAAAALAQPAPPSVRPGERLGDWEVLHPLGSGGMGEVFEARRADGQYQARAAIKLLKRGMDSAAVLARFAQERQALAHLSHPHIARLLDAGATAAGLPYFVMEYVPGRPIHEAALALPLEQRLGLFLQLADAVAHAHRHLLVHRDLKPGNVLVDQSGQVKLLDFGIAKALDPLEAAPGAQATTTLDGARPYTPQYASPEQVRGERVTTATDIYSLGVVLYQMLTGARPTGRQASTPHDAARSVLEDAPTRPSRLSATEALDPRWLQTRRRLEGDLDNILLKTLEKQPERRYTSVEALAADIRAFLEGRPVSARPASLGYLVSKFAQRHRVAVAAAALGGLGLVLGLAAALLQQRPLAVLGVLGLALGLALALVQARRAALARDQAQSHLQVARAIARDVMERQGESIEYLPGGADIQARMLGDLIEHLRRLRQHNEADDALAIELATAHARLAHLQADQPLLARQEFGAAEEHAGLALQLFEQTRPLHKPAQPMWWGRAWRARCAALRGRGALDDALRAASHMQTVAQWGLAAFPGDADLLAELGSAHFLRGQLLYAWGLPCLQRPADAEAALAQAQAVTEQLLAGARPRAEDQHQLATVKGARMMAAFALDEHERALQWGAEALALRQRNLDAQPGHVAMRNALVSEAANLSFVAMECGQAERALALADEAQVHLARLAHDDPANPAWPHAQARAGLHKARALVALGRAADALPLLQALTDPAAPPQLSGGPARAAWALAELALARLQLGDIAQAQADARAALHTLAAASQAEPANPLLGRLHARALAVQGAVRAA